MTELVGRKVDVLVTSGTAAAIAARKATTTVPIVVGTMGDPVRTGLVNSLARPGGNLTGLSLGYAEGMPGKWLQLLQDMVPRLSTIAVVTNPSNPMNADLRRELVGIAAARGLKLQLIEVQDPESLNRSFEQAGRKVQAVLVLPDPFISENRRRVTSLAAKYRLPAIYPLHDYVDVGGLMAYGPDFAVAWARAADYVDKILKGAKPGDLPIEQPNKFELVVNLKTARTLGIMIPESILLRADEVIR
jgi:putative ABC transport system substrate-binding protein